MKTKQTRKLLSLLLALVMVAAMLPTTALAATEYDVWVGGVQVTSDNCGDIAAASGKATGKISYNDATKTLTLENATITGDPSIDSGAAIYAEQDLTIQVIGTNTVTGAVDENGDSRAICISQYAPPKNLTITGTGSLTARAGGGSDFNIGIFANGALTVTCAALTAEANGGNACVNGAISARYDVEVNGCTLTATAASAPDYSYAIATDAGNMVIKNSTVTVSSGAVDGDIEDGQAIWALYDLSVTNSTVTASSDSVAIYCQAGALKLDSSSMALASTSKDGSGAVTYNAADNDSYKYLLVTPALVQYPVTGGSIWFDMSTGSVVDCSKTVTAANILGKINGVEVIDIGNTAFRNCSDLTSLTLPDSLDVIGDYAFKGCTGLTDLTLGKGLTYIAAGAFQECTALTEVTIPADVAIIDCYAFYGCTGLTTVTFEGNCLSSIPDHLFEDCENLESVNIPDGIGEIMDNAFKNCKSLTEVTIPSSVNDIYDSAFLGCTKLTGVTFEGDAPAVGTDTFPAGTTLYYRDVASGWTTPEWNGYPTVEIKTTEPIAEANIMVTVPMAGEHPSFTLTSDEPEKYTATVYYWYLDEAPYPHLTASDPFAAGKVYKLRADFEVKAGYEFTDSTVFTINGQSTNSYVSGGGRWREIAFSIAFFTVTFDANGGEGFMDDMNAGDSYTLPECGYTAPKGKQFKCWSVGGAELDPGDVLTVTEDTVVKAVWENVPEEPYVFPFTDVPADKWYYESVKQANKMGLINGKTETTYEPESNMTYAEAIKLAACMNQLYNDGKVTLVGGAKKWYDSYYTYCLSKGIISSDQYGDLYAKANVTITRAEYAMIFANALPDAALAAKNTIPNNSVPDVKVSDPWGSAVYKLYRAGIIRGNDDYGTFAPDSNIKRSEVATILIRMMDPSVRVGAPALLGK